MIFTRISAKEDILNNFNNSIQSLFIQDSKHDVFKNIFITYLRGKRGSCNFLQSRKSFYFIKTFQFMEVLLPKT